MEDDDDDDKFLLIAVKPDTEKSSLSRGHLNSLSRVNHRASECWNQFIARLVPRAQINLFISRDDNGNGHRSQKNYNNKIHHPIPSHSIWFDLRVQSYLWRNHINKLHNWHLRSKCVRVCLYELRNELNAQTIMNELECFNAWISKIGITKKNEPKKNQHTHVWVCVSESEYVCPVWWGGYWVRIPTYTWWWICGETTSTACTAHDEMEMAMATTIRRCINKYIISKWQFPVKCRLINDENSTCDWRRHCARQNDNDLCVRLLLPLLPLLLRMRGQFFDGQTDGRTATSK